MLAIATGSSQRVLVVDDERHLVKLLETNLRRHGHTVTCAYGGNEAIACLERQEFDLAVIDRDMPDRSGEEVVAWIRSHERTKGMRVVLLCPPGSSDGPDDPPGADRCLSKPFSPGDLFS